MTDNMNYIHVKFQNLQQRSLARLRNKNNGDGEDLGH